MLHNTAAVTERQARDPPLKLRPPRYEINGSLGGLTPSEFARKWSLRADVLPNFVVLLFPPGDDSSRVSTGWAANFGVKPARPGFGPAAELPTSSPA